MTLSGLDFALPRRRSDGPRPRGNSDVIEVIAVAAERFARSGAPRADRGRVGQWCDGVAVIREDRLAFADYWQDRNDRALATTGPLWAVLGDSTAIGLGAPHPRAGYVGQTHAKLADHTGQPWRIVNLARSGAITRDVLDGQLARLADLPVSPDLVTCGIGANDILQTPPARLHAALRAIIEALPAGAVMLDLPLPTRLWGIAGRAGGVYVGRVNRTIHTAARERGLPVAKISTHFTAPWAGKFGPDSFHPSHLGYRDWSRALFGAILKRPIAVPGAV